MPKPRPGYNPFAESSTFTVRS